MKVLLADDNPLILERFVKMTDWKKFGYDTVLKAIDGKAAWNQYEKYRPELIITDIQMPKMTGVEFAQKVREVDSSVIIYFLSSYEEFAYAKAGMELGVAGYLLKHETNRDVLEQKLTEVEQMIRTRRLHIRYSAQAVLHDLVCEMESGMLSEQEAEEYRLSLPGRYDLLFLEQDHIYPALSEFSGQKDHPVPEKKVSSKLESCVDHIRAVLQVEKYQFLVLMDASGGVTERSFYIKSELMKVSSATFSVFILAENLPILECGKKYKSNKPLLGQKYFFPRSSVVHANYLKRNGKLLPNLKLEQTEQWLKDGKYEQISRLIDQSFLAVTETRDLQRLEEMIEYFSSLLLRFHNRAADFETGRSFAAFTASDSKYWYDLCSIQQWMQNKFSEVVRFLTGSGTSGYSEIVTNAIAYINGHYDNCDLGLNVVAGKLRISESRLNTVFKKETGETVWKFIIKVRMAKALELLDKGNDKITEICGKCGYRNISYFSKVFKDTYGMTPMEYRRKKDYGN